MDLRVHSPIASGEDADVVGPSTQAGSEGQSLTPTTQKNPWVLKRLSRRHKDMIALSLQGLSREKVAEFCGCTPQYVTMINKQPLARIYIQELEQHLDLKLRGLYERSIDAIKEGLSSPKISDKLAAAQLQLETIGKRKPIDDENKTTAEDVVSAMLIQGNNVQVNVRR